MKHYDYLRGLKAPHSLQLTRSPKGKIVWVFPQSLNLSYVLMLFFWLIVFGIFLMSASLPTIFGVDLNLLVMLYLLNNITCWDSETEVDGKYANLFIKGFLFIF